MSVRITSEEKSDIKSCLLQVGKTVQRKDFLADLTQTQALALYRNHVEGLVQLLVKAVPQLTTHWDGTQINSHTYIRLAVPGDMQPAFTEALQGMSGAFKGAVGNHQIEFKAGKNFKLDVPTWMDITKLPVIPADVTEAVRRAYEQMLEHAGALRTAQMEHDEAKDLINKLVDPCESARQLMDAVPGVEQHFKYKLKNKLANYAERLEARKEERASLSMSHADEPEQLSRLKQLQEKAITEAAFMGIGDE